MPIILHVYQLNSKDFWTVIFISHSLDDPCCAIVSYGLPYIKMYNELESWAVEMFIFINKYPASCVLTHWGRVTHIYVGNLIIIDSDNGLSPGRRQDLIWSNAGIL